MDQPLKSKRYRDEETDRSDDRRQFQYHGRPPRHHALNNYYYGDYDDRSNVRNDSSNFDFNDNNYDRYDDYEEFRQPKKRSRYEEACDFKNFSKEEKMIISIVAFGSKTPFSLSYGYVDVILRHLEKDWKNDILPKKMVETFVSCLNAFPIKTASYAVLIGILCKDKDIFVGFKDLFVTKFGEVFLENIRKLKAGGDKAIIMDIAVQIKLSVRFLIELFNLNMIHKDFLLRLLARCFDSDDLLLIALKSITALDINRLTESEKIKLVIDLDRAFDRYRISFEGFQGENLLDDADLTTDQGSKDVNSVSELIKMLGGLNPDNDIELKMEPIEKSTVFMHYVATKFFLVQSDETPSGEKTANYLLPRTSTIKGASGQSFETVKEQDMLSFSADFLQQLDLILEEASGTTIARTGFSSIQPVLTTISIIREGADLYGSRVRGDKTEEELPLQGIEIARNEMAKVNLIQRLMIIDLVSDLMVLYENRVDKISWDLIDLANYSVNALPMLYHMVEAVMLFMYGSKLLLGSPLKVGRIFQEISEVLMVKTGMKRAMKEGETPEPTFMATVFEDLVDSFVIVLPTLKDPILESSSFAFSFFLCFHYLYANVNYTRNFSEESSNVSSFAWEKWTSLATTDGATSNEKVKKRKEFIQGLLRKMLVISYRDGMELILPEQLKSLLPAGEVVEVEFNGDNEVKLFTALRDLVKSKPDNAAVTVWLSNDANLALIRGLSSHQQAVEVVLKTALEIGKPSFTHLSVALTRLDQVFLYLGTRVTEDVADANVTLQSIILSKLEAIFGVPADGDKFLPTRLIWTLKVLALDLKLLDHEPALSYLAKHLEDSVYHEIVADAWVGYLVTIVEDESSGSSEKMATDDAMTTWQEAKSQVLESLNGASDVRASYLSWKFTSNLRRQL